MPLTGKQCLFSKFEYEALDTEYYVFIKILCCCHNYCTPLDFFSSWNIPGLSVLYFGKLESDIPCMRLLCVIRPAVKGCLDGVKGCLDGMGRDFSSEGVIMGCAFRGRVLNTEDNLRAPPGGSTGVKKFRYTQPKKKTLFDDDDDEQHTPAQWSYTNAPADIPSPRVSNNGFRNAPPPDDFDLDEVWSIKRNINVPGRAPPVPSNADGWSKNVGKNFYSRHGGLNNVKNGENKISSAGLKENRSPKHWDVSPGPPQKTFSYSYASSTHSAPINLSPAGSPLSPVNRFESQGMSGLMSKGRVTSFASYGVQHKKPF
ncbi:hypothetical protein CAPTEDRAFT_219070 [Capitella teleta]|uniref:Uncharacterized protein n=1 Tax=Capitella teleta TaxID=283909 RepID=R7VGG6_CAPTE|nr:hypothetical protein CAPTEDRAFT_219070 [Capitella teleta]|eukprot:ELU17943.1 hypothetical protein CAPTEDRAFT_219070 [Capitella teleta]